MRDASLYKLDHAWYDSASYYLALFAHKTLQNNITIKNINIIVRVINIYIPVINRNIISSPLMLCIITYITIILLIALLLIIPLFY